MAGNYNLGTAEGIIRIKYDGSGQKQAEQGVDQISKKATSSGASIARAGRLAGVAGAVIAGGLGLAAKTAVDFEKQISAIGAVSGATQPQLDAFRKKALQLGADTQFSASQAATAMEELAKAGVSVPDILNGAADAAVALAAAGGVSLPEAATLSANAMNSFNISARDMNKVVDLIAGAANASAIDVGQFGQSLQQVGAVAHLSGLSFKDTAVAIAEMGNAGIKGSDAGTSLKTFLQNLIPTTKQQIKLFKDLGLSTKSGGNAFFDASGKVKSLADISQILQTALKGQTKEQQLATLQTLFGSDAIRAAAVFANNGAAGFNNLAKAMGSTSAAGVAAQRMNNTAGQIEQLKGSVETAAIAFGELLLPALTRVAKSLTQFANFLTNLSSGWKNFAIGALLVGAALLGLVSVVFKIIEIVRVFRAVWLALNASFLFSPIGLIIIAIVALVAAFVILWTKSAAFRNFWIGLWNAIWGFLKAVGAWFAGPFANFFVSAFHMLMNILHPVIAAFQAYIAIVMRVINFVAPIFVAAFHLMVSIVKLWWTAITTYFTIAFAVWKFIFHNFIDPLIAWWRAVWNVVVAIIRAVWGPISAYIGAQIGFIKAVITAAVNYILAGWRFVWNAVRAVISAVWPVIVGIVRGAVAAVVGAINGIRAIVDRVRSFFGQLRSAASGGVGSLISFVAGIPGRVLGAIGNLGSLLFNAGKQIIQGLINGVQSLIGHFKSILSSLTSLIPKIKGPLDRDKVLLHPAGQAIMLGLIRGIQEQIPALRAVLSAQTQSIPLYAAAGVAAAGPISTQSTVQNNNVTVNTPSQLVNPNALGDYIVRKLNSKLAVRG